VCSFVLQQRTSPGPNPVSRLRRPSLALMLAIPALAAIAVYLPALPGGFLSDDYSLLHTFYGADAREVAARVGKTFVSGVGPPSNQYRPLTMASFALNAHFSGANAAAWRLVNVLLHGANAALVALLAWQLAGVAARGARSAALAAGLAFAWFAPSAEAVAWVAARFDEMSLFWTLVAACTFMASDGWRDRHSFASLGATVLAFMSKESAAIAPALIVALAWVKRPEAEGLLRSVARALVRALPWIAIAGAYFVFRATIFGDPFRFYPGTSPGTALLSGKWLAALPASRDWWPLALPETGPRMAFAWASLLLGVAAVSASLRQRGERRVLVALVLSFLAALAMLFSHTGWSVTGEGGRVLYAIAAIAALAVAIPLRMPDRRLRFAAWIVAIVLLGSGLILTQAAVERRAHAGAEVRALNAALAQTADAVPAGSYAFVIVPDHLGSIPFARNALAGLMLAPVQTRSLSAQLIVLLADDLPAWPAQLEKNIVGRLKVESIWDVAADREASGTHLPPAVPDRFYCWSPRSHALVALPLAFQAGFSDWNEVWGRALDAAGCRA
jgi:hypothetical protein